MVPPDTDHFLSALAVSCLRDERVRGEMTALILASLSGALPEVLRRAALPVYLTKKDLCKLTGWSTRKLDYMVAERRIPCVRRGRSILFKTVDIEAFLNEGYVPATDAKRGGVLS